MQKRVKKIAFAAATLLLTGAACANELVVAHVGPFSGPLGGNGTANHDGSRACIDQANANGGVHGRKLRLVREDDQYKPDETVRLLREVAQRDKPIAFVNLLGSANASAVLKDGTMDALKVPVVGVTPGADVLRAPGTPWMFHVQASDNAQLRRILTHLSTIGLKRIGVVYQDIPFGQGGLKFIQELAPTVQVQLAGSVAVPSAADDLAAAAAQLRKTQAQAYVMVLAPNSGAALVRDVRAGGDTTPVYGMSYVPVKGIVDKAGAVQATGVGLAQVTPNTFSAASALVRQFHAAMDTLAPPVKDHSQLHLIGYLHCRVLVEGLQAAGRDPTPERLKAALHKLRAEVGGYLVDFAGGNVGSRYVDIGVVTREGRLAY